MKSGTKLKELNLNDPVQVENSYKTPWHRGNVIKIEKVYTVEFDKEIFPYNQPDYKTKNIIMYENELEKIEQQTQDQKMKIYSELSKMIGKRVRERDSNMTGTIKKFHMYFDYPHYIMKGDNQKTYDKHVSHYTLLSKNDPNYNNPWGETDDDDY